MSEETIVEAAPSVAEPEIEVARGPLVTLTPEQRSEYKKTGNLPVPPKKEEQAPPEPKGESAAESDPATGKQEHTEKKAKPTAEERIAQLESTIEKIRKGAGIERKADPAPAPEPKAEQRPAPPQNYQEWRKQFKPSQWTKEWAEAHPEAEYEDATAAMNDFLDDVRSQFRQAEERQRASDASLTGKLNEARKRYGDKFDEVLKPALETVMTSTQVLPVVRELMSESEVLPELLYTIGGEMEKFLSMPPGKQARYIALTESLIHEELTAKEAPKGEAKEPPAKPQTSAPKPPAEVGGRANAPGDELESAARANDFRRFSAESTRRALAHIKG
jgi:hypothetical protein